MPYSFNTRLGHGSSTLRRSWVPQSGSHALSSFPNRQSLSPRLVSTSSVSRHFLVSHLVSPCLCNVINSYSTQRPSSSSYSPLRLAQSRDGPPPTSSRHCSFLWSLLSPSSAGRLTLTRLTPQCMSPPRPLLSTMLMTRFVDRHPYGSTPMSQSLRPPPYYPTSGGSLCSSKPRHGLRVGLVGPL